MAFGDVWCTGVQVHTEMLQKHVDLYHHGMEPVNLKAKAVTWAFKSMSDFFKIYAVFFVVANINFGTSDEIFKTFYFLRERKAA